jgi:UPF0755 protein
MSDPTPSSRRGRHSSDFASGVPATAWMASMPPQATGQRPAGTAAPDPYRVDARLGPAHAAPYAGARGGRADNDHGTGPLLPRAQAGGLPTPPAGGSEGGTHPSAPLPGLPPRPAGTWSRMQRRTDVDPDDAQTVAQPVGSQPGVPGERPDDDRDAGPADAFGWDDDTGGLEVLGASDDETRGSRHRADDGGDEPPAGRGRRRRGRSPVAVVLSLLVLAGLVGGIVVGGKALIALVNPPSEDFVGQGSGDVQIRIAVGDTLSDIGRTLESEGVIASVGPFVDAAELQPAATGIQPGVYGMREGMSGQAALDLLLDPASRLFSRVTIPEGFTVQAVLGRVAEATDTPVEELQAVAADPAALGLPAYANGSLEGFLFPATYDFTPDDAPADMLREMIQRTEQALAALQIPEDQRLTVLTKASLVQAEASSEGDMAKVARVLENRLAIGMALQLDTTVNYANGKGGITTTPEDRANLSPYNTYQHPGLPPGPINNPGEQALRAVLAPAEGDWRYFVVVDPDTGDTRFAVTAEEHQANVLLFQQWLRENPGG